MSIINYDRVLFAAFFTQWGTHPESGEIDWGARLLLHGPPGAKKTATTRQLAKALDAYYYSLKPGAKGQGGFGVTPVPTMIDGANGKKQQVLSFPGPDWVGEIGDRPALIVVDEMNTAAPALQAPLLGLTQEKEIGSTFLPARARVIGCTNSVEDAAGGWDLAPSIANRLGHIDWPDPDLDDWAGWMLQGASSTPTNMINVAAEEARVTQAWPGAWAKASGLITSFLKRRPGLLRKQPKSHEPQASRAWPSPRTWEYATRVLCSAQIHSLNEAETDLFIAAYIGEAATHEFAAWKREQDLPDPALLLEGKEKFEHNPIRLDRTMVVFNQCAALVAPAKAENREARAQQLWKLLLDNIELCEDLIVPVASTLWKCGLYKGKEATTVLAKCKHQLIATTIRK